MRPQPGPLSPDARLRAEVIDRLRGGHAFVSPETVLAGVPEARVNERPNGEAHSLWDLLWHIRATQADMLTFCLDPEYAAPPWPAAYWPDHSAAPGEWDAQVEEYLVDVERFMILLRTEDLTAEFAHAPGYTLLREALLAAEHTAHHLGQVIVLRRRLALWPPGGQSG